MGMPAMNRAARNVAVNESLMAQAKLALALKRYRAEHGAYPGSLDALGIVPKDPLTGQAFSYRLEGAGFVLQSKYVPPNAGVDIQPWRAER
jgi:hypothetical protein